MRIEVIVEVAATSSRSRKIKIKIKSVCVVEVQTDRQTDQLPFVGRAMRCDAMYGARHTTTTIEFVQHDTSQLTETAQQTMLVCAFPLSSPLMIPTDRTRTCDTNEYIVAATPQD